MHFFAHLGQGYSQIDHNTGFPQSLPAAGNGNDPRSKLAL